MRYRPQDKKILMSLTPTRLGNMCAQMRQFLDPTGGLWKEAALAGDQGDIIDAMRKK